MTEFATRLVLALVALVVTAWSGGLFKIAHQWAAGLKDERIAALADKLVLAAEQQFGAGAGETKLNWVLEQSWCKGLGVDREDIEAAVRIMNSAAGTAKQEPGNSITADLAAANAQIIALQAKLAALASITPASGLAAVADHVAEQTATGRAQEFAGDAIANAQDLSARLRGGGV